MSGLRFCMLTTFYPPYSFGGDAIGVQRLSRALVRRGHEVTVVHDTDAFRALHGGSVTERPDVDEDEGVRVIRLRSRFGALSPLLVHQCGRPVLHASRLRRLLRSQRFDVVNFHNVSLIGGPGLLHYPEDAVTVYMAHEHWLVCPTNVLWRFRRERCDERHCLRCVLSYRRPPQLWRYTGALRRALERIDSVVAMSEFSREKHREFGLSRSMDVLPPFVPDLRPAESVAVAPPQARPYFLFAGRLEVIKGLDDVIPVFRRLPHIDLLIAGDGGHERQLRALASGMPNIRFLGRLDPLALAPYFQHSLAALVPSVCYETFGIVLIDAFRQGTPAIVRAVGPLPEVVRQSGAGATFTSADELETALRRFADDEPYRVALGAAATEAVRRHWTESVVIPAYLEIVRRAGENRQHDRIRQILGGRAA